MRPAYNPAVGAGAVHKSRQRLSAIRDLRDMRCIAFPWQSRAGIFSCPICLATAINLPPIFSSGLTFLLAGASGGGRGSEPRDLARFDSWSREVSSTKTEEIRRGFAERFRKIQPRGTASLEDSARFDEIIQRHAFMNNAEKSRIYFLRLYRPFYTTEDFPVE